MRFLHILSQVSVDPNSLGIPLTEAGEPKVAIITRIVFGIAGGVALIIVTVAGLQYVLSRGDPAATAKAKNTILYALVGLVISITAFTIVTFVIGQTV